MKVNRSVINFLMFVAPFLIVLGIGIIVTTKIEVSLRDTPTDNRDWVTERIMANELKYVEDKRSSTCFAYLLTDFKLQAFGQVDCKKVQGLLE